LVQVTSCVSGEYRGIQTVSDLLAKWLPAGSTKLATTAAAEAAAAAATAEC
jgi:hypothetical protein